MSSLYNILRRSSDSKTKEQMAKTGTTSTGEAPEGDKTKTGRKGKKKADSTSKSITCIACKQVFTEMDAKIVCCDRCENWYCNKCAHISDEGYRFLSSREAENISWFCNTCKDPARSAVLEDKSIEDKCREYTDKLHQKLKLLELNMQKKAESTELQDLQKRLEECEKNINRLQEDKQEGQTWADIVDSNEKKTVEEVVEKSLKERDNEEKERQNRRKNIIIFGLPESKKSEPDERKDEDVKKFVGLCKNKIMINMCNEDIEKAIRLGKVTEDKERPLLITLKDENKKREVFQNLNKLRDAGAPFNKVIITHELTKKQKEELKDKIQEAQEKERQDESGDFMYRVRGPPWSWYIKKIPKRQLQQLI